MALPVQDEKERAEVLSALILPDLIGTDEEITEAQEIRQGRIEAALSVYPSKGGHVYGVAPYQLGTHLVELPVEWAQAYKSRAEVIGILTASILAPDRLKARWWIETRDGIPLDS